MRTIKFLIVFLSLFLFAACSETPQPTPSKTSSSQSKSVLGGASEKKTAKTTPLLLHPEGVQATPSAPLEPSQPPASGALETQPEVVPAPTEIPPSIVEETPSLAVEPAGIPTQLTPDQAPILPVTDSTAIVPTNTPAPLQDPVITPPTAIPTTPTSQPRSTNPTIRGSMTINFGSRTNSEATDVYDVNLTIGTSLRIRGKIIREARVVSAILGREQKPLVFRYLLTLWVINPANPSQEKKAGAITGTIPVTKNGVYNLAGLAIESEIQAAAAPLSGPFSGEIQGKAEDSEGVVGATYTRLFGGKKVSLQLAKIDPLNFKGVRLAGGPIEKYAGAAISGNLDYDFDTGNWLTSGLTIKPDEGKTDLITGSVKWSPDADRSNNGKGQYEFNLRYNEGKFEQTPDEGNFFESVSDEEAFFVVDDRIPTLRGVVRYKDTFSNESDGGEPSVIRSQIQYDLEGDKLTTQQLVTFAKWWLLIVGTVNDE